MTFPAPYIRMSFGGSTADGNEIWSCGLPLVFQTPPDLPIEDFEFTASVIEDLGTAVNNFIGAAAARVPNNTKTEWIKLALIGTDGKYMTEPVLSELDWGGSVNAPYSPQDALVVTLVSDIWRGVGKYNRFYLPTAGPAGTNAWKLNATEQAAFAAVAVDFIEALNITLETVPVAFPPRVGVVSDTRTGSIRNVQSVMVGQIVDTQRRRRNKLDEAYLTTPIEA